MSSTRPLYVLHNSWALGDTICLSALVRDLDVSFGQRYRVAVTGHFASYWKNNPHATTDFSDPKHPVHLDYRAGIRASSRGTKVHFLTWFYRDFKERTGIDVPVLQPKGDFHFSPKETPVLVAGDYWLVVAGGKLDLTTKIWHASRWQEVVDKLSAHGIRCVQAGSVARRHVHPKLNNVVNLVGQTESIRDFMRLVRDAKGVICGVTAAMHAAAVFDKPCIVIAGGREETWWEGYFNHPVSTFGAKCAPVAVPHRFIHTIDQLDCCRGRGCWKNRVVPIEPADYAKHKDNLCRHPIRGAQAVPQCLDMISSDTVVSAVLSYDRFTPAPPVSLIPLPVISVKPASLPKELPPKAVAKAWSNMSALDNPVIGGKFTIFVLCYGDFHPLATRCIDSVLNTVPAERRDLRVGANAVCARTEEYLRDLEKAGTISKLYLYKENKLKYPVMRTMFHDALHPIRTPYVIWLDDDSYVVNPAWLSNLSEIIIANHQHGGRLYGAKFWHDLAMYSKNGHRPELWFRSAPWWRGINFYLRGREKTAPNGSAILFAAGGAVALAAETIKLGDIPDSRLTHHGDICVFGAQVTQSGGKIVSWNDKKTDVNRSAAPRRGHSSTFPWAGK